MVSSPLLLRAAGSRPRILVVLGTRPEAIKLAPVALALRARPDEFEPIVCSTGQHRDMLDQALNAFDLVPDLDLGLMRPRQTLASLTSRAMTALDRVMRTVRPDLVLVQGDTTSAFIGAMAAFYQRAPVAHLEAGLRTGDVGQPFPEEANRRLITPLAALHFAPTQLAARRLRREGVPDDRVLVSGNTVIDALLHVRGLPSRRAPDSAMRLRTILLTMHRRESFGRGLERICRAVVELVERNPRVEVRFPVHASPFVREPVQRLLGGHPRIILGEPLAYRELVRLLDYSYLVLTDSGGIQEEAPALGKPVLVLRDKTERPEAIQAGTSRLVGSSPRRILAEAERLLRDPAAYREMAQAVNPYGDGRASERVVGALRFTFGLSQDRPEPFAPCIVGRRSSLVA